MPDLRLVAQRRTESEIGSGPSGRLRRAGWTPAVVYGLGREPVPVKFVERDFEHLLREAHGMHVISLTIEDQTEPVLLKALHRHPVTRRPLSADLIRVDLTKPIRANVRVRITARPTDLAADETFEHPTSEVEVECLPGLIPSQLEVDASAVTAGSPITVASMVVPEGVKILAPPDTPVAVVRRSGKAVPEVPSEEDEEAEAAPEGEAVEA